MSSKGGLTTSTELSSVFPVLENKTGRIVRRIDAMKNARDLVNIVMQDLTWSSLPLSTEGCLPIWLRCRKHNGKQFA